MKSVSEFRCCSRNSRRRPRKVAAYKVAVTLELKYLGNERICLGIKSIELFFEFLNILRHRCFFICDCRLVSIEKLFLLCLSILGCLKIRTQSVKILPLRLYHLLLYFEFFQHLFVLLIHHLHSVQVGHKIGN